MAFEATWQLGLNAGVSRVSPDPGSSGFSVESSQSRALGAYLGLDITPTFSIEFARTDLGEAEISQNQSISYAVSSLGATAYFWGAADAQERSTGMSGYARVGLSMIDNDSELVLSRSDNTSLWLGVGLQIPIGSHWGIRTELTSFDGDAQALTAGVFLRIGANGLSSQREQTAPGVNNTDNVDVVKAAPRCPASAARSIPVPDDCEVLNSILEGLEFSADSTDVRPSSTPVLERVAQALRRHRDVIVEVRVHTSPTGDTVADMELSVKRARSLASSLIERGISTQQLRARAFGATQISIDQVELRSLVSEPEEVLPVPNFGP